MSFADSLGVQSYCFRGFKENAKVAELIRQCGLSRVELCGVHADFMNEKEFDGVIETYRKAGVSIVSIGVQGFNNDAARERKFFEFAKRAGAKVMGVDFGVNTAPACFRTAEQLADEFDINLAIHNHGGRHWLGCAAMLRHVFATTTPRIGLCLDTAWAMDSGEDAVAMVREFGQRLYGLHVKDFIFDLARRPKDVVAGQGNLDLKKLLAALKEVNFAGAGVFEYEGDVDNPVPALTHSVAQIRHAEAG